MPIEKEIIQYSVFLIYFGAAVLATIALFTRQVLPVVYIVLGAIIGPGGFGFLPDLALIEDIAHIGIVFLLFLLGLDLYPQKLLLLFRSVSVVTFITSSIFFAVGFIVAVLFGFTPVEAVITGIACSFSSTIIGLKLLPTTSLHHRHIGELVIGILLVQDILAILALIIVKEMGLYSTFTYQVLFPIVILPIFLAFVFLTERYVVRKLLQRFELVREYIFLVTISWCLTVGELGHLVGLTHEIGAFAAGVSMAASPIARYVAERMHALRDFFMVLFFVAIGAHFDASAFMTIIIPATVLSAIMLAVKPAAFSLLLRRYKEGKRVSLETGFRLGQLSEFSILIVFLATSTSIIGDSTANFLIVATVLTFIGSCYLVVFRYPTPVALSERLRRD